MTVTNEWARLVLLFSSVLVPDEGFDHCDESLDVPGRMDHQQPLQVLLQPEAQEETLCDITDLFRTITLAAPGEQNERTSCQ